MITNLPAPVFSYFGRFLELREISILARVCKNLYEKIKKDGIFFNYSIQKFQINSLPKEFASWKDFVKEATGIKWEIYDPNFNQVKNFFSIFYIFLKKKKKGFSFIQRQKKDLLK